MEEAADNIRVVARVRPLLRSTASKIVVETAGSSAIAVGGQTYAFDAAAPHCHSGERHTVLILGTPSPPFFNIGSHFWCLFLLLASFPFAGGAF